MPAGFIAIGGLVGVGGAGIGAMVAGIAVSAVVGAAIGGISAAVMGGDIGKGMLFGAVGGVVTGGLAGGGIANMFSTPVTGAMNVGSVSASGVVESGFGQGLLSTTATTAEAATTVAASGASKVFGGVLNSKFLEGAAGPLMSAAGSLFKETPYDPNTDLDWLRENREDMQEHDLAKISASSSGGSSGGSDTPYLELERLRQVGALDQIAAEAAANQADLKLQGEQGLAATKQEYKLQNSNAQAEWDRGLDKLKSAADVASTGGYQSGEGAYEAVKSAQVANNDTTQSRGALAGVEGAT